MAFTRFNYDDARTKKKLQEATGPGRYILNVPAVGKWMSAVVWADVDTGANNPVKFDWMRSA